MTGLLTGRQCFRMILSLACGLCLALPSLADEAAHGVMMVVKGDIKVTSAADSKTEAAKVGRKVLPGDTIVAGPDSRAKIVMSDKNVLNISPDSKLVIEKYTNNGADKNVELKVEYGKIRASVEQKYDGEKSKFNVKTPSAVAGVRGTDFLTSYNAANKQSQVITFSGTVAVGKPGPGGSIVNPVFVQPGQMTSSSEGKPPEPPKAMPAEELNKMKQETSADTGGKKSDAKPASEAKKDDKKEDKDKDKKDAKPDTAAEKTPDKSADNKDGKKPEGDGKGDRAPANAPAPSMVDSRDLGPELSKDVNMGNQNGNMPKNFSPTAPMVQQPIPNQFINDAIRNQKTSTTINISK